MDACFTFRMAFPFIFFFGMELDVTALFKLLSSDAPSQARAIDAVALNPKWVAGYFGTLLAAAYVLPHLSPKPYCSVRT